MKKRTNHSNGGKYHWRDGAGVRRLVFLERTKGGTWYADVPSLGWLAASGGGGSRVAACAAIEKKLAEVRP